VSNTGEKNVSGLFSDGGHQGLERRTGRVSKNGRYGVWRAHERRAGTALVGVTGGKAKVFAAEKTPKSPGKKGHPDG